MGGSNIQYHTVRPYIPPIQLVRTPSQTRVIQQFVRLPHPTPLITSPIPSNKSIGLIQQ